MILIGIAGKKGAGKDTVGQYFIEAGERRGLTVVRRAFADALKWSAARLFEPEISLVDAVEWGNRMKEFGSVECDVPDYRGNGYVFLDEYRMSGRLFLQRYGTEAHRGVFGDTFWVDALLPPYSQQWWDQQFDEADIGLVTDVRFPNEAERVGDYGIVIQINRPGLETGDGHASEQPLPANLVDYYFDNDSSLEDLRADVDSFLEDYLIGREAA